MAFFSKVLGKSKKSYEIDKARLPEHIAIIMDGNGRWAGRRGLPRNIGHKEGSSNLKRIVGFCDDIGIKYLTVYAFSTENWKRPKSEVDALMSLMLEYLKNARRELGDRDIRIRIIGDVDSLPSAEMRSEIRKVEEMTRNNRGLALNIAINYGGRAEIITAVKKTLKEVELGKLKAEDINEKTISDRLYTSDMPDPDLLIRPSGEKRISNFLLWQSAYTEFWYTNVLWPDFRKEHLLEAIRTYQNRERRYGGI